jgi:hypothetical protein
MDSFFLSETMKYLYLLFNTSNFITKSGNYVFNTGRFDSLALPCFHILEAHMYPFAYKYQQFCQKNEQIRTNGNFDLKITNPIDATSLDESQQCVALENGDKLTQSYTQQCSKLEVIHSFDAKHFIRKCMF